MFCRHTFFLSSIHPSSYFFFCSSSVSAHLTTARHSAHAGDQALSPSVEACGSAERRSTASRPGHHWKLPLHSVVNHLVASRRGHVPLGRHAVQVSPVRRCRGGESGVKRRRHQTPARKRRGAKVRWLRDTGRLLLLLVFLLLLAHVIARGIAH